MSIKAKKRWLFAIIGALVVLLLGFGAFFWQRNRRPEASYNVLLILMNNLAANHSSAYGYPRKTTPNLDKLAANGVIFENTFSQASWTLPSGMSLFTSQYPYTHAVMTRGDVLDRQVKTLAEVLRENGYKTAAFTGGGDYVRGSSFERGFGTYKTYGDFGSFKQSIAGAKKWLKQNENGKFFLTLQGYDMHPPYTPPQPYDSSFLEDPTYKPPFRTDLAIRAFKDEHDKNDNVYHGYYYKEGANPERITLTDKDIKYLTSQYDGEIAYVDKMIGDFVKGIDKRVLKRTIIVIASEHGEMFAKHGRFGRAGTIRGTLYDDVIHVPLIILDPNLGNPRRIKSPVQLIDVMPTILDLLSIPIPRQAQGKSLRASMESGKVLKQDTFAGAKYGLDAFRLYPDTSVNESVRSGDWKLIHEIIYDESENPKEETFELYDMRRDKEELNNLIKKNPEEAKKLKMKLFKWDSEVTRAGGRFRVPLSPELIEEFRKYGYW